MVFIRLWFCLLCFYSLSPLFSMLESSHHRLLNLRRPENYLKFLNYRSLLHSCKKGTNQSLELSAKSSDLYETSQSLTRFIECLHWSRIWGKVYSASTDNIIVPCCRVPPPFKVIYADVVLQRIRLSHIIWKLNEVSLIGELKSLKEFVTTLFANQEMKLITQTFERGTLLVVNSYLWVQLYSYLTIWISNSVGSIQLVINYRYISFSATAQYIQIL